MYGIQVRIKVVEARQLEGSNVHPVCKLTLFGETKQTRVKRATGSPRWNEVFYYSSNISPAEIVDEMVKFEVRINANIWFCSFEREWFYLLCMNFVDM